MLYRSINKKSCAQQAIDWLIVYHCLTFHYKNVAIDHDLLPRDHQINRVHLLSRVNNCAKFSNSHTSIGQQILSGHHLYKDQQFDHDLWPHDLKFSRHYLLSWNTHGTKISYFQATGSLDIEGTAFKKIWSLILIFYHVTWKSKRSMCFLGINSSTKFSTSQAKGSKDIEWTSFVQRPGLWPWPFTTCLDNQ